MRIEFYKTQAGNSPVSEFITSLPQAVREEVFEAISRLANGKVLSLPLIVLKRLREI